MLEHLRPITDIFPWQGSLSFIINQMKWSVRWKGARIGVFSIKSLYKILEQRPRSPSLGNRVYLRFIYDGIKVLNEGF